MSLQVDDRVVLPAHGVGSVVGLVDKSFSGAATRQYYEIAVQQGTVWVPVDTSAALGLRSLTGKAELTRYRAVLMSRPAALHPDHRQRRLELLARLKSGRFLDLCEVVRDLTARGWRKALGEADAATLRQLRDGLSREWAAADEVSVGDATREVDALLAEGRRVFQD